MGAYAVVAQEQEPIVHVRVVAKPTDESFTEYINDLAAAFRRLDRFGVVFDAGGLTQLPGRYRDQLNRWIQETEEEFKGRFLCSAFVIQSRVVRGVLVAMYWLQPPYYEHRVVSTSEEAFEWVRQQLRVQGVLDR